MSANRGIYILRTKKDGQHRVICDQAIENIFDDSYSNRYQLRKRYNLSELYRYFVNSKFTRNRLTAFNIAEKMEREYRTEYGIKVFEINMNWSDIEKTFKMKENKNKHSDGQILNDDRYKYINDICIREIK